MGGHEYICAYCREVNGQALTLPQVWEVNGQTLTLPQVREVNGQTDAPSSVGEFEFVDSSARTPHETFREELPGITN